MEWIASHSALNRLFFMAHMAPPYVPEVARFWYIGDICCSLILANGNPVGAGERIPGDVPILIFAYGTGSNIESCYRFARRLAVALRIHVLLFDYPGYGCTRGIASERACCNSIERVIDHVVCRMRANVDRIILFGHSLGTGVASWGYRYSARYGKIGGLILLNPFLSLRRAAQHFTCFGSLMYERFRTDMLLASNPGRILIIHGQRDTVIPVEQGWALFYRTAGMSMPDPTPSPLPEHVVSGTVEGWFPLEGGHDRFDLDALHARIGAFVIRRGGPDYVNDTPRVAPSGGADVDGVVVPIIAAVGELTMGPTVDVCEQCFFL